MTLLAIRWPDCWNFSPYFFIKIPAMDKYIDIQLGEKPQGFMMALDFA